MFDATESFKISEPRLTELVLKPVELLSIIRMILASIRQSFSLSEKIVFASKLKYKTYDHLLSQ